MKIMTILGTRPEIIRLSRIIAGLDLLCDHILVHTGQNFDWNLNDIFFEQLKIRNPDAFLGARGTFGEQISTIFLECEKIIIKEKPDKLLFLGDTNSALSALIGKRLGIPIYHMEAGNRCYDDRVPEEVNRRVIDHSSDILMPYTERSRQNLLQEGIESKRIFVIGNPIYEVILYYQKQISQSKILKQLSLSENSYFLITLHRAENVDNEIRLRQFISAFNFLQKKHEIPVIISTHPRTRDKLNTFEISFSNPNLHFLDPFNFFDFVTLEKNALCVLTDSGTVQEECSILKIPVITLRDTTELPETIECGSNLLTSANINQIINCVDLATSMPSSWEPPKEYLNPNVSQTVLKIILGFQPR